MPRNQSEAFDHLADHEKEVLKFMRAWAEEQVDENGNLKVRPIHAHHWGYQGGLPEATRRSMSKRAQNLWDSIELKRRLSWLKIKGRPHENPITPEDKAQLIDFALTSTRCGHVCSNADDLHPDNLFRKRDRLSDRARIEILGVGGGAFKDQAAHIFRLFPDALQQVAG